MPHINVVYPFVSNDDYPRVVEKLRPVLSKVQPFTVKLGKLSYVNLRTSASIYTRTETEPAGAIMQLQKAVEQYYPDYNDLVMKNEHGFEPQLSLGQFEKEEVESKLADLQASWKPLEFQVKELHLVSRKKDTPFEVRYSLQLAGQQPSNEFPGQPIQFRTPRDPSQSSKFKLFVNNLAWNVDSNMLKEAFADLGANRAYVIYDRTKDRSKGFGFIEFENEQDQLRALQNGQGRELEGRQLLLRIAVESKQYAQGQGGQGGQPGQPDQEKEDELV